MTRRKFVSAAAAASAAASTTFPRPAIAQLVKVRYTLSWLPTGQYAFIYSARQLGYFKNRGIDLEIARGYGSMAAIQAVSTGQFDMGGAQTGATLLSIIKGLDLRILGTQGYDATLGVVGCGKQADQDPKGPGRQEDRRLGGRRRYALPAGLLPAGRRRLQQGRSGPARQQDLGAGGDVRHR